jgi:Rad3-related DNA helicase
VERRTYSLEEAAQVTNYARESLEEEIRSGALRTVERDGAIRIPHAELRRRGLLAARATESPDEPSTPADDAVIGDLTARLERQAAELGGLRLLTVHAESLHQQEVDALRSALHETEARAKEVALQAAEREEELRRANSGLVGELRVAHARIEELRARIGDDRGRRRGRKLFARWTAP